jgi:hypothetical protein
METQIPFEQFMQENPDFLAISHSQIENWDRCQRLWHYVSMHKLATEVTWPMKFSGTMLHPAFSRWYKSKGREIMGSEGWQVCWRKYMDSVQMIPCPNGKGPIYSQQHASNIVTEYINQFDKDFEMYRFLESEEKRYKVLPGLKVVYLSIPDLVLERIGDDKVVVNDFKHSTWDMNADLDSFDRQLLGQAYVTGAQFLMKTHILSSVKSSRDYGTVASFEIKRPFDPVESDQMDEWIQEVCQTAEEILRAKEHNVFVKQAPKGCFAFNKKCEFHNLCSLGAARIHMIETLPKRERD